MAIDKAINIQSQLRGSTYQATQQVQDLSVKPQIKQGSYILNGLAEGLGFLASDKNSPVVKKQQEDWEKAVEAEKNRAMQEEMEREYAKDYTQPTFTNRDSQVYKDTKMQIFWQRAGMSLSSDVDNAVAELMNDPERLIDTNPDDIPRQILNEKFPELTKSPEAAKFILPILMKNNNENLRAIQNARAKAIHTKNVRDFTSTAVDAIDTKDPLTKPKMGVGELVAVAKTMGIPEKDVISTVVAAVENRSTYDVSALNLLREPINQAGDTLSSLALKVGAEGQADKINGLLAAEKESIAKRTDAFLKEQADQTELTYTLRATQGDHPTIEEIMANPVLNADAKVKWIKLYETNQIKKMENSKEDIKTEAFALAVASGDTGTVDDKDFMSYFSKLTANAIAKGDFSSLTTMALQLHSKGELRYANSDLWVRNVEGPLKTTPFMNEQGQVNTPWQRAMSMVETSLTLNGKQATVAFIENSFKNEDTRKVLRSIISNEATLPGFDKIAMAGKVYEDTRNNAQKLPGGSLYGAAPDEKQAKVINGFISEFEFDEGWFGWGGEVLKDNKNIDELGKEFWNYLKQKGVNIDTLNNEEEAKTLVETFMSTEVPANFTYLEGSLIKVPQEFKGNQIANKAFNEVAKFSIQKLSAQTTLGEGERLTLRKIDGSGGYMVVKVSPNGTETLLGTKAIPASFFTQPVQDTIKKTNLEDLLGKTAWGASFKARFTEEGAKQAKAIEQLTARRSRALDALKLQKDDSDTAYKSNLNRNAGATATSVNSWSLDNIKSGEVRTASNKYALSELRNLTLKNPIVAMGSAMENPRVLNGESINKSPDNKGEIIGLGLNLKFNQPAEVKSMLTKIGIVDAQAQKAVIDGKLALTADQSQQLYEVSLQDKYIPIAKSILEKEGLNWDNFTPNQQAALAWASYNGPQTTLKNFVRHVIKERNPGKFVVKYPGKNGKEMRNFKAEKLLVSMYSSVSEFLRVQGI